MNYDLIVIGGGPAGMFAAITAAEQGSRVLLLEANNRDIHSSSEIVETEQRRVMVYATDAGDALEAELADLALLLELYRTGKLTPCAPLEKD